MKVAVLMNAGAGSIGTVRCEDTASAIAQELSKAGVEVTIHRCEPHDLAGSARRLAEAPIDAVIAAGGDGTVSAVASGLAGTRMPMAVLPLGTLNHFARDLGMPTELADAARAIAAGTVKALDVGAVNDRVFINNSSIGLYAAAVKEREADRKHKGRGKWTAMLFAALRVLRAFPRMSARVTVGDKVVEGKMPIVFVGNNEFTIEPRAFGRRPRLDGGALSIYCAHSPGPLRLLWHTLRAIIGRPEAVKHLEVLSGTSARIDVKHHAHAVRVAVDGEIVKMTSPLHYEIRAGALLVVTPPAAAETVTDPVSLPAARIHAEVR